MGLGPRLADGEFLAAGPYIVPHPRLTENVRSREREAVTVGA
jgi:hypothetical protein